MQSLNLEKIQNVDIKDTKTLTIIIIFIMVCFACIYVWQTKKNEEEGFIQYNYNNDDLITLASLDNVLVRSGTGNLVTVTSTINNIIDAKLATSQQSAIARASPVPVGQNNILSLVGIINATPIANTTVRGDANISGSNLILGLDSAGNQQTHPRDGFHKEQRFIQSHPDYKPYSSAGVICLFDWINDNNIFFNNSNPIRNIIYSNVYPKQVDSSNKLISPFTRSTLKKNTTYLLNLFSTRHLSDHTAIFYVIYNFDPNTLTITKDINYVNSSVINVGLGSHNGSYSSFVVQTTNQTLNIGVYCTNAHWVNNVYYGMPHVNNNDRLSLTVYEVINPLP